MLLQERQSGSDEADVIDEEEFVLLKQERDAKRSYRCLVFNTIFSSPSPSPSRLLLFSFPPLSSFLSLGCFFCVLLIKYLIDV